MLPRLLTSTYAEDCRLHPTKLGVKINLMPISTATMALPEGEPTIILRKWMELYGPYGSLGYFRVAAVKTDHGDGQNINLEHGIASLGDSLTAADTTLTGTPYAIMGTLLGYQGNVLWQRGTIPNTGNYTVTVNRSNVLAAVLDLLRQMDGYGLTYSFATVPWKVGIAALETTPTCECRMRHNATDVKITLDDNDLCTRVYATGLTGGYMDADTVGTWGIIAKNLGTPEDAAAADVQAYATKYLAEYKNPRASIEITALGLSERTGEALDVFGAGKLCRVALPDWGYTTNQRIVTVNYPDILGSPEEVKLSLSNAPRDLGRTLAGISNDLYGTSTANGGGGGGGGGGGSASGLGKLTEYRTAINRNTDNIELVAWDVDDINDDLISAMASITINADNIELKVSKNGVISSINQTPESITISASKVNLVGYVTASQLSAAFAAFENSTIDSLSVTNLGCASGVFSNILTASYIFRMGTDTIDKATKSVMTGASLTVTSSGGVVTSVTLNKTFSTMDYLGY